MNRVTLETIEAFELAGLADELNACASLLRSPDGVQKNGERGWEALPLTQLIDKAFRHLQAGSCADPDSGEMGLTHAVIRVLMLSARLRNLEPGTLKVVPNV